MICRANTDTRFVVLHLAAVSALDSTRLHALETLRANFQRDKKHLILSGAHTQPFFLMDKAGPVERVGAENVTADLETAVARARKLN